MKICLIIYLRIGNSSTARVIEILRANYLIINQFNDAKQDSILILS